MVQDQQSAPIMVRVVQPTVQETSVADVLIGSIGLTGVLVLIAVLLGAVLGGVLIGVKKFRQKYNLEAIPDSEALRVTPAPQTPHS